MEPITDIIYTDHQGFITKIECRAATKEEAQDAITWYMDRYPPMGYDTRFSPPKLHPDGYWVALGSRLSSCD